MLNRFLVMRLRLICIFLFPCCLYGQSLGALSKSELTQCYTLAISDYLKSVYYEHQFRFDTLYFGKDDQFPDIKLPAVIENTYIQLLSPDTGLKLQKKRKDIFFVNMIGWGDKNQYEFMLVTFTKACEHQFDWRVDYKYNVKKKIFEIGHSHFDYYLFKK